MAVGNQEGGSEEVVPAGAEKKTRAAGPGADEFRGEGLNHMENGDGVSAVVEGERDGLVEEIREAGEEGVGEKKDEGEAVFGDRHNMMIALGNGLST